MWRAGFVDDGRTMLWTARAHHAEESFAQAPSLILRPLTFAQAHRAWPQGQVRSNENFEKPCKPVEDVG